MPHLGLSEILIVAIIAIPLLAVVVAPVVVVVVLWQRQSRLSARLERLEAASARRESSP